MGIINTNSLQEGGASPHNLSIVVDKAAGNNRAIAVAVAINRNSSVSAHTCILDAAGVNFSMGEAQAMVTHSTPNYHVIIWYVLDTDMPATAGTYDIDVTHTLINNGNAISVYYMEDMDQTAPSAGNGESNGTVTPSISTTAGALDSVIAVMQSNENFGTYSQDAGQTELLDVKNGDFVANLFSRVDSTTLGLTNDNTATQDHLLAWASFAPSGAASASLDDVNTNEIVVDAETGVTITTSNFGSDITSFKITSGGAETSGTGLAGTGGSFTVNLPDVAAYSIDTAGAPFTTASHAILFQASDGVDSPTLAGTYNPKTGYAVVETLSAVKTAGSVFENFTGTIVDGSQVLYPTASNTSVSATGILTTDSTTNLDMQFWDESDDTWKPFSVIIESGGGGSGSGTSKLSLTLGLSL